MKEKGVKNDRERKMHTSCSTNHSLSDQHACLHNLVIRSVLQQ